MIVPDRAAVARALAAAALVLAVTSKGDALVLGAVLVLLELRPASLVAVSAALAASSWRWGSTSLDALAGAQAVLGPAGWVGPTAAAAGSWLAALALLLTLSRGADPIRVAAVGATVAAVVAGPGPGGQIAVRAGVALAAAAAALALGVVTEPRPGLARAVAGLAVLLGVAALVAVAGDAPAWPPHVDPGRVAAGAAVAVAASAVALIGALAAGGARWSRGWSPPRLSRPR